MLLNELQKRNQSAVYTHCEIHLTMILGFVLSSCRFLTITRVQQIRINRIWASRLWVYTSHHQVLFANRYTGTRAVLYCTTRRRPWLQRVLWSISSSVRDCRVFTHVSQSHAILDTIKKAQLSLTSHFVPICCRPWIVSFSLFPQHPQRRNSSSCGLETNFRGAPV